MKNKAIFLDRDGTINVDKGYVYKTEDFEFIPGAIGALKLLQDKGYLLIIVTNQSGIARGYYTEEEYNFLTEYMLEQLKESGINITDVLYCPHLIGAPIKKYNKQCECRKPNIGLYLEAQRKWNIDFSKSYAVGDKLRDCAICEKTSCRGFVIDEEISKQGNKITCRVQYVNCLEEVARIIDSI